jgi:hypothetical protein
MAREFAQIKLAIWADDDWRDLSPMARYLYLTLLTSPTLNHCGVADWRPSRIGALNGMSIEEIEDAGAEMVASLHLLIDEESEEVLIRSFVRNDGLMKQPKMATAMATAHAGIASQVIRGVIVHELIRLRDDLPDLHGWGSERAKELLGLRSVNPSEYPLGKGSTKGNWTPFGNGSEKGFPTPVPTPATATSSLQTSAIEIAEATRPDVGRLCERLADRIEANGAKRPAITARWRDAARLMLDADGHTEAEVTGAIDWCQADEFWRANVLSMPKLREKYDQLRLQAQRARPPGTRQQETDDLFDRAAARMGVTQ